MNIVTIKAAKDQTQGLLQHQSPFIETCTILTP